MTPHVHSVHQKAFFSTEYNKRQKRGEHCPHLLPVRGGFSPHPKYALIDKNTRQKMRSIIAQTTKREKDDDGSDKH